MLYVATRMHGIINNYRHGKLILNCKKLTLRLVLPLIHRLKRADLVYVYHYTSGAQTVAHMAFWSGLPSKFHLKRKLDTFIVSDNFC